LSVNKRDSYQQILKTSSIIGGAQGINYLIGMVRTKVVAILLGPAGVGLVGLYMSVTAMVTAVAGLGIGSSGVRDVAEATGSGDPERIGKTVRTLRRVCWVTGILGWVIMAIFSHPLSLWIFESSSHAWAISILGATVLLGEITTGQTAFIQGMRRIGDLARLNILSMISGTVISIGIYAWLGERGIVPVLILTALVTLGFSTWYSKKISVPHVDLGIFETIINSRRLLGMGVAFMWSSLLSAGVVFLTRAFIVRELGLDANGIYQAGWGISGMFAGFIIAAMGTDFFPRLTAVSNDNQQINRLVNEQTEIGVLLALPGILGTLAFAPFLMKIFYTSEFVVGADLLPWFILGVFGKVISWPMGFILLAKGLARWFVISETFAFLVQVALTYLLLRWTGLVGVSIAFAGLYLIMTIVIYWVVFSITRFTWSPDTIRLLLVGTPIVIVGFALRWSCGDMLGMALGGTLTIFTSLYCLRGIFLRVGSENKVVRLASRVPLIKMLCR
jgi:antigen flippase